MPTATHSPEVIKATAAVKVAKNHEAAIVAGLCGCDLHGIRLCPICVKVAGQCDFGACETVAAGILLNAGTNERRPMCSRHIALSARLGHGKEAR